MVDHNSQTPDDKQEPTTGEWIRALVLVVAGAVLVTGFLIWMAFTFFFKSCGTVPTCA